MKGPLLLSKNVVIQSKVVETLAQYQVDGIRFMYQQCILKGHNVVLNNDPGMNEERQVCTFLSAVEKPIPSLIVCQSNHLKIWYYESSQVGLKVTTADELMKDNNWESSDWPHAVLLTQEHLKHLKSLPIESWFFFIIQNLECLETSRYIKNVDSDYRIGIVDKSYVDLSPGLQWFAMKWANSHIVEPKDKFIKSDCFNKSNLLGPFPDYWRRITWDTIKNYKPTEEECDEYNETVEKWCRANKPSLLSICNPIKRKASNKRNSTANQTKKRRIPKKEIKKAELSSDSEQETIHQKKNSSDDETQELITDIQPKIDEGSNSQPSSSKKAQQTLISDKRAVVEITSDVDDNFILNSLIDSPESNIQNKVSVSDDENESCRILDLLL